MTTNFDMCRSWMEAALRTEPNDPAWIDAVTGETCATRLAEDCADHFDDYLDRIDWEIPQHIWDAAAEVAISRDERMAL